MIKVTVYVTFAFGEQSREFYREIEMPAPPIGLKEFVLRVGERWSVGVTVDSVSWSEPANCFVVKAHGELDGYTKDFLDNDSTWTQSI